MSGLGIAIVCGGVVGVGVLAAVMGLRRPVLRLDDALGALDDTRLLPAQVPQAPPAEGLEAAGTWLHRRLRLPLSARQQQLLLLQGRSAGDFFTEKLVLALMGALLPALWYATMAFLGRHPSPLPLGFSVVGAVGGYFLADARLATAATSTRRSAVESIHTFFDLVVLERLANASASQAVGSAAQISTSPLFRRISAGLERARLEQVPPWRELRQVAHEWNLPELGDFADVMRLEEQGAALADVLAARVKELRDAHLARQQVEAQEATEALTLWMTLPALLLGVTFVVPPLLQLTGG
ncbi:MAG: type II secretion system F family protein [Arachnia sp.]